MLATVFHAYLPDDRTRQWRTHAHTHARAHTHAHTHEHAPVCMRWHAHRWWAGANGTTTARVRQRGKGLHVRVGVRALVVDLFSDRAKRR